MSQQYRLEVHSHRKFSHCLGKTSVPHVRCELSYCVQGVCQQMNGQKKPDQSTRLDSIRHVA